jgi:hypothetical protein
VKWLIDSQIAGDDSLRYSTDGSAAPAAWLSWGPYLWADGLTPRSDGLTWSCSDFVTDGTHPSASGRATVADSLLAFFRRDATTTPWYLNHTNAAPTSLGAPLELAVRPLPVRGTAFVSFTAPASGAWRIEAVDIAGRRVAEIAHGGGGGLREVRWDARSLRPGVYWLRLVSGTGLASRRLVLVRE